MINPVFNLDVSARTNKVVWKYASHQLSQAAVECIDSLILDWTHNRALAWPAVQKREKKPTSNNSQPNFFVSLQLSPFLAPQAMFGLLIVYCSKELLPLWTGVAMVSKRFCLVIQLGLWVWEEVTFFFGLLVAAWGWGAELKRKGILGDMVISQRLHSI